ncbi:MAG: sigma-70 family RNA polymerase sigma factor [Oscillospiraceae bacterium]|nr:sigma-70 family RNA polymerase sigma factor [Oscillospiraceae bacterium]
MSADLKEQYDTIYRYCSLRVKCRETAEDITQETFLRYLENPQYHGKYEMIRLLYTIAGNLCIDEFRRKKALPLSEEPTDDTDYEELWTEHIALKEAICSLSDNDRELILMRYINEVPLGVLSSLYNVSRFSLSRRLKKILSVLRNDLDKEVKE